mgnify:FL=1
MTALIRRNGSQPDAFTSLARDFFGFDPFTATPRRTALAKHLPQFDLTESPSAYTLHADLPGVTDENLDVTVHEGVLTVSGKREEETSEEGTNFLVRERRYGEFSRRLALPKDASTEAVQAKLANGVLLISIPKKEELKARKIKVG